MVESSLTANGLSAVLSYSSDWGAGYCADVVLTNVGSTTITAWEVQVDLAQASVTSSWSAAFSTSGGRLVAKPLAWNGNLAVGAKTTIGFCASSPSAGARPTVAAVSANGAGAGTGGSPATGGTTTVPSGGTTTSGGTRSGGTTSGGARTGGTSSGGTSVSGGAGTGVCGATYEAESMAHSTGNALSGGWNVYSNGNVSTSHSFVAGANRLSVVAKGDQANGAPRMRVSVGGQSLGEVDVPATAWTTYSFNYNAPSAGARTIQVEFLNDYQNTSTGADRNLHVDKVTVTCGVTGSGGTGSGGTGGVTGTSGGTGGVVATGGVSSTCTQADLSVCSNQTGTHCGYTYEYWKDQGTGCLVNTKDGFRVDWSNSNNLLGRKGLRPGSKTQIVTYSATYNPVGNSYLCVYGWTKGPLVEYYIVDSWGTWRPPGGQALGTVTSDGGTYDIYRTQRVNQPSIEGNTTFYQYWSVRTAKRTSGTISVGNHFDAWARLGMTMGSLYEVSMTVEGYQSSGSAAVSVSMR